jgi:hypothetical protein
MAPMEYLGAWGTLIHEKNLKSKILCQTPFNTPWIRILIRIRNADPDPGEQKLLSNIKKNISAATIAGTWPSSPSLKPPKLFLATKTDDFLGV